ncbi:class I SAM-dependent methyltransferase [Pseudoponticoccus marisrubri]|uniref:Ubiquinone biosynthesis methyltransferase UbiE n=1 Tax=Pseudoponticoccus marisrubri TaxID=1685382 RepID=A0A0W7WEQ2_9RHOB|nr:class I SAM-dependent methyltransferase [Pseudoponticoccus marisrubri]KUF09100.1 hypothetical protein AVJ23_19445 [Pseudoponticoccus marisrubri]
MDQDLYEPARVAAVFDRCSRRYRGWSSLASFGVIHYWRRLCVAALGLPRESTACGVDLMAGTGELWPHLLARHPRLGRITAIDISPGMHAAAMARLHAARAGRITHLCADMLRTDLPDGSADFAVSSFGLKTFNAAQHRVMARQIARILRPGAPYALIEAADPDGWVLHPLYRIHLDRVLPLVERLFLDGAQDFAMLGAYTRGFGDGQSVVDALAEAGLSVRVRRSFGGAALCFHGHKPH